MDTTLDGILKEVGRLLPYALITAAVQLVGTRPTLPAPKRQSGRDQGPARGAAIDRAAERCSGVVASRTRGSTSVRYSVGSTPLAMQEPTSDLRPAKFLPARGWPKKHVIVPAQGNDA